MTCVLFLQNRIALVQMALVLMILYQSFLVVILLRSHDLLSLHKSECGGLVGGVGGTNIGLVVRHFCLMFGFSLHVARKATYWGRSDLCSAKLLWWFLWQIALSRQSILIVQHMLKLIVHCILFISRQVFPILSLSS